MSAGLQTTFTSFWGQFGWMGVPLDPRTVKILMVTTAVALLGGLIAFARAARALTIDQRWSLALIATLGLSTAGVFIYYNLGFQPTTTWVSNNSRAAIFTRRCSRSHWSALPVFGNGFASHWRSQNGSRRSRPGSSPRSRSQASRPSRSSRPGR